MPGAPTDSGGCSGRVRASPALRARSASACMDERPRKPRWPLNALAGASGSYHRHALAGASGSYHRHALAGASGSTTQTATIVTPSSHAIVSTQVLLELALWCQQRLAYMEEYHRCHDAEPDPQSPPAQGAPTPLPDDSSLARVDAATPVRPVEPVDHAAAPSCRPGRSPRKGGGR
jgi:hypothetical protein